MTNLESPAVAKLYDNLTPINMSASGDVVWVMNHELRFAVLPVATATTGGDAGSARHIRTTAPRMWPGLNRVQASYWTRVEADAERQRARAGGILATMIDEKKIERVNLAKASVSQVAGWLANTANLGVIADLRKDKKHSAAAQRCWDMWHDATEASDHVKTLRHFWAMSEGSRKVA